MISPNEVLEQDNASFLATGSLAPLTNRAYSILLVEDNPVIQTIHQGMLAHLGCEVEVVSTAEEALADLGRTYDLILLDIALPGMNGLEAAAHFCRHPDFSNTPIVAVTTNDELCFVDGKLSFGFKKALRKPVEFQSFEELIGELGSW